MDLMQYFESARGIGVLSTADSQGRVDSAIYSRPHVMDDGTIVTIMRDRLTHLNLQSNPYAVFLFKEDGPGFQGKRIFLKKIKEEENPQKIVEMSRRQKPILDTDERRFLVYFTVEKILPLIGSGA
jgi:hypothetical protein